LKIRYAHVADLPSFDEIVDVRTPAEFAVDHIPGATNAPVLTNDQRIVIGTMYRSDAFGATRLGASMVAHNIAEHLETLFADRPSNWRPLIYCWRGGKRSASMTSWFNLIGWHAQQLAGGYKSYRRSVLEQLDLLPPRLQWIVLRGLTGCGKTRLLNALGLAGGQVLDLEALACHRGSLLGGLPDQAQPSQKAFDSALAAALSRFDCDRPVFVESESRGIGSIRLPTVLLEAIQNAPSVEITASAAARIAYLSEDYAHLFEHAEEFKAQLERLRMLHGKEIIERWMRLIDQREVATLFGELIELHYDPAYRRGQKFTCDARLSVEIEPLRDLSGVAMQLLSQAASLARVPQR
jgi:tRNA 2-selenouridine synthase